MNDTVEKQVDDFDKGIEQYERSIGLPPLPAAPETEVLRLLSLSKAELRGMSADDCGEASVLLQNFAFHLQRAVNREKTKHDWCVEHITKIIAPTVSQQKGWSLDERRPLAVRNDDVARRFDTERIKAQNRLNSLNYLAAKVENSSRRLSELQETKRKQHG